MFTCNSNAHADTRKRFSKMAEKSRFNHLAFAYALALAMFTRETNASASLIQVQEKGKKTINYFYRVDALAVLNVQIDFTRVCVFNCINLHIRRTC